MLRGFSWAKAWAADAHDACFAASLGRRAGQLMLMMHASQLPLGEGLGQLMLMMLASRLPLGEGLGS